MIGQMIMAGLAVAAAAPKWTPASLSNTKAWYVADNPDNTVVGGLTTVLADKSGAGFAATAAAGGAVMSDILNGRATLRTSAGAGVFMSVAAGNAIAANAGAVSIFAVHRQVSLDGASYPAVASASFGNGSSTLQTALMRSQAGHAGGSINLRTRPNTSSGGIEVADETNYGASWIVAGGMRRYANDDGFLWINGVETAHNTGMVASHATQSTGMSIVIGSYNVNGDDKWTQNIAEVVVVRNDIPVEDRERIEGYLAWEWGTQADLPADHPYKAERPMGGTEVVPPTGGTWTQIATENGPFTLAAPGRVRYGADVRWSELELSAGNFTCGNDLFGDPASGVAKVCELLT